MIPGADRFVRNGKAYKEEKIEGSDARAESYSDTQKTDFLEGSNLESNGIYHGGEKQTTFWKLGKAFCTRTVSNYELRNGETTTIAKSRVSFYTITIKPEVTVAPNIYSPNKFLVHS